MKNSLTIGCHKKNLPVLRQFVQQQLESAPLSEPDKNLIVLALDEVCSNLIIHSNQSRSANKIRVEIELTPTQFSCSFFDRGIYFDISRYVTPAMEDIIREKKKGGIGLILVKEIMNRVEQSTDGTEHVYTLSRDLF